MNEKDMIMTELKTQNIEEVNLDKKAKKLILSINDHYSDDINLMVKWLNEKNLRFDQEGVELYLKYIRGVRANGRRYSARSYNKKISAIKNRIRILFKLSPKSISDIEKLKLQAYLDGMKYKKISLADVAITDEKVLSPEEIKLLIEKADKRLSLFIEFLSKTGCRISEMLNILLSDCKRKLKNYEIRVLGKGNKERTIFISKELYNRIVNEFKDDTYLFGHGGKPYNRIAVTNRVKIMGKIYLDKSINAHMLRHSFITTALNKGVPIEKVSRYVGHSSVNITDKKYNHNGLTFDDFKNVMD